MATSEHGAPSTARLPVDDVLPDVVAALAARHSVVLEAPPGAGKTTRVPLALLDLPTSGRILLLEPRRLAARASARRMAALLGEQVGATVGLTTRDDRRVSDRTRIEVVTEGVLVRRLQRDPSLDGVATVVFDEFHERSLDADLGLALTLEARRALRPDLRLLVMSATLDGERVADLLDDGVVVKAPGRAYPVATHYRPRPVSDRIESHAVAAVLEALAEGPGDVLVFLDGAATIRRVVDDLAARVSADVTVAALYGALGAREQDRALQPAPHGRKVVVATDIAETSLTIPGVRAVVDSGWTRTPRFDAATGLSRLETVRVSRDSADQRRGRAGRTGPGICLRLWAQREHAGLRAHRAPEIALADLAGFALEVAAWGATGPGELPLLDQPPPRTYNRAVALLTDLEALDRHGRITEHGRALVGLPLHPRLAHMVVRAAERRCGGLACDLAALLADRDVLAPGERSIADLALRVRWLRGEDSPDARIRHRALQRARREAERLRRRLGVEGEANPDDAGAVLALAYPDRAAQQRGGRGRFVLASGRGATLPEDDLLAGEPTLVVADVDRGRGEARIHLAAAVDLDVLEDVLAARVTADGVVEWDPQRQDVVAERRERLGQLVLRRSPLDPLPDARTTKALLVGLRDVGLDLLPWGRPARDLQARAQFVRRTFGQPWPAMDDQALLDDLEDWLAPFLAGRHKRADLSSVPLVEALRARIGWSRLADLDALAPSHHELPTGTRAPLDYASGETPVLAARVQQLFGATETPRVAAGRVPVTIHLLSPAHRPVQVTQDLAGFWDRAYHDVRAELRGRYPKHHWPEDPRSVPPTDRAKRRR